MKKPTLHSNDIFGDALEEFKATNLYNSLVKEFTPIPYWRKYRVLYWLGLVASYVFNIFSGFTASALVFFFLNSFIHWIPSLAFTMTFLLILELSKRKASKVLFKDFIQFKKLSKGLLFIVVMLSISSIVSSYFGAKKTIHQFTRAAPVIALDTIEQIQVIEQKLKRIDGQIEEARETKWNDTTTRESQRTISSLSPTKAALELELSELRQKTNSKNENIEAVHQNDTQLKAEYFAAVTLLLELLFLGCQFWVMTYKYNSLAQFADSGTDTKMKADANDAKSSIDESLKDDESSKWASYGRIDDADEKPSEPSEEEKRTCLECEKDIGHRTLKAKFCDDACRKKYWSEKNTRPPFLKAKK